MTHPYTQAEFDAFGWSPFSRSSIDPAEAYGLDYESARDATPRWYAVSFGNGNDGVSHTFPDYYVRTNDPFHLAAVAMLSHFNRAGPEDKARIIDATSIDGESDYTISATIYNPEDIEESEDADPDFESLASEAGFSVVEHDDGFVWVKVGVLGDSATFDDEDSAWEDCCSENDLVPDPEDEGSYCDANGAWLIVEVFAVDPMPSAFVFMNENNSDLELVEYSPYDKPAYASLADAFEAEDLRLTAD